MKALLRKEFGLTGSPITYLFILTAFMAMIPNYPTLAVTMIVSIGLIVYFQGASDARDTEFYAILPVKKRDIVKAKFQFVVCIELLTLVLLSLIVAFRAVFLGEAAVYVNNPMMNANAAYLGYALSCFALFNRLFLATYFKNGCTFVKPSIFFFVGEILSIGAFEALHNVPGLAGLNSPSFVPMQAVALVSGVVIFVALTAWACRTSADAFEKADL